MNKSLFSKILPHLVAFLVFLIVSVIYCRPALEGKVLQQHDITQWQGAFHQSEVYKEKFGHMPLWTQSMFSGMPIFQIGGVESANVIPGYINKVLTLGLPTPIAFFFLACICFYFLCIVLRVNPYIGILGAIGFAYATYNPVIIIAGHETKMWAISYMPALLGSILLIFDKRYLIGTALTAAFTATLIAMNHPQIAYYFFLSMGIMTIFFLVRWVREKDWKHVAIALSATVIAAIIGVLVNAVTLFSTYEYQKETIRGGASALTDTTQKQAGPPQTGLDKDYAFSYSASITEPLVMMVPRLMGGSVGGPEISEDKSKALENLQQVGQQNLQQIAQQTGLYLPQFLRYYWGGISQDGRFGGTSGPPYSGAIICFLAILSFFVLDSKHKWWALAAILFACVISWGSYFKAFNYFLFDHLPFYNKFRAPSMALVIPQLLLPMLAVLGLNAFVQATDKKALMPAFKKGLIATGAVFVVLFVLYISYKYLTPGDSEILNMARNANQPQFYEIVKSFYDGLIADRKSMLLGDIFRSLGYVLVAALLLFLMIRNSIKPLLATILLSLFVFVDLITVDSRYLNSEYYQDKVENENNFRKTKADEEIQADTSYYRVFNFASDFHAEAYTSYYYNSLGGYHAVKLRLYQDIIERQLAKQQPNMAVLNMLNAKYFIQRDQAGLTQQYQKNEGALGPCWLVKHVQFVKNADEEMASLDHFNPGDTAFVQESFKASIPSMPVYDSTATIQLVKNEIDQLTYNFNAASNQFAVFSEVYYKSGWKAFIDGKEAPIVKTDYVLRGLAVPAGKHTIELKFEPQGYLTGKKITLVFTIILAIMLALGVFAIWRDGSRSAPKQG